MASIITVFGATGNQGGSVIRAILNQPALSAKYTIRAITRDISKPAAQELTKIQPQGNSGNSLHGSTDGAKVQLLAADMDKAEDVKRAVQGATAVFGVTNFWESLDADKEVKQAKSVADAAKAAGVHHLIWSSLPDAKKLSNGKYANIAHFQSKADAESYIESIKGSDMLTTYVQPAFFMNNFDQSFQGEDTMTLNMPWGDGDKTQVPLIDIRKDMGIFVAAVLTAATTDPKSVNGRRVQAVSQWMTPNQIVAATSKALKKPAHYNEVPPEVFKGFLPAPVAEELTENQLLIRDFSYFGTHGPSQQAKDDELLQGAKRQTLESWLVNDSKWASH